jgi:DNA polymerase elongation subunit (family B)
MNYIVYDIETYHPERSDKFDVNEFKVSVTGVYVSWIDEYLAFTEEHTLEFIELMKQADLVIGFNHIWFDNAVLQKYSKGFDLTKNLNHFDLMLEMEKKVGFKIKLDAVAEATLGANKTDTFAQFVNYYWDKEWFKLVDYCMHDVKLTHELFLKVMNDEPLFYKDLSGIREIILDKPVLKDIVKEEPAMESIF